MEWLNEFMINLHSSVAIFSGAGNFPTKSWNKLWWSKMSFSKLWVGGLSHHHLSLHQNYYHYFSIPPALSATSVTTPQPSPPLNTAQLVGMWITQANIIKFQEAMCVHANVSSHLHSILKCVDNPLFNLACSSSRSIRRHTYICTTKYLTRTLIFPFTKGWRTSVVCVMPLKIFL